MSTSPEKPVLEEFDVSFSFGSNEINALTLFSYLDGPKKGNDIFYLLQDLQAGGLFKPVPISRQRIQDRVTQAADLKLLKPAQHNPKPSGFFELTESGLITASVAGHLMRDVSIADNQNLSYVFGIARNNEELLDPDYRVISPALTRAMVLRGLYHQSRPLKEKKLGKTLGLDVTISSHALIQHTRHLTSAGYLLALEKKEKPKHPLPSRYVKLNPDILPVVEKIDSVIEQSFFVDTENWPTFMAQGLRKAREVLSRPEYVTNLLLKRDRASTEKNALDFETTIDLVRRFGGSGNLFSSGEFNQFLPTTHTKFYASQLMKKLVAAGIVEKIDSHVPKYVRYRVIG